MLVFCSYIKQELIGNALFHFETIPVFQNSALVIFIIIGSVTTQNVGSVSTNFTNAVYWPPAFE